MLGLEVCVFLALHPNQSTTVATLNYLIQVLSLLRAIDPNLFLASETDLGAVISHIDTVKPELLIIDSIQTLYTESVESSPGSVVQVRECTANLLRFAKQTDIPIFLIGHITKDGTIAGPKVLEHMVDAVLQFEGDRHHIYRLLRSIKNRFGSTNELGIYSMQGNGLLPAYHVPRDQRGLRKGPDLARRSQRRRIWRYRCGIWPRFQLQLHFLEQQGRVQLRKQNGPSDVRIWHRKLSPYGDTHGGHRQ